MNEEFLVYATRDVWEGLTVVAPSKVCVCLCVCCVGLSNRSSYSFLLFLFSSSPCVI